MSHNWTQQWTATAAQTNPTPPPIPVPEPARGRGPAYAVGTVVYAVLAFLLAFGAVVAPAQQATGNGGLAVLAGLGAVTLVVILRHLWSRRPGRGG
jgi:peptidoglycan/LPS O-acetylase OafA/YrhL